MARDTVYARSWRTKSKNVGEVFTVERAQRRHVAGEPYTAVLRTDEIPYAAITVHLTHGTVIVRLLDRNAEQWVRQTYELDKQDTTRMGLDEVTFYHLGAPNNSAKYHFNRRNGPSSWELNISTGAGGIQHCPGHAPASWDEGLELSVPAFGEYDHLVRPHLLSPHEFVLDV